MFNLSVYHDHLHLIVMVVEDNCCQNCPTGRFRAYI